SGPRRAAVSAGPGCGASRLTFVSGAFAGDDSVNANAKIIERSLRAVWHPCTQMKHHDALPLVPVSRAEGPWLYDFEGRRILDAIGSWWVNLLGHGNARINSALMEQLASLEHVMLAGFTHAPAVELAERHADETAALIVEPLVQCAGGMAMHDAEYLRRARALCDRFDVHLIADEIAVGFGRTGTLFACEQAEISPDFLCLSKGLTGGYLPLSVVLATERAYRAFYADKSARGVLQSHSYSGSPLAC